ncbi:methyltransferase domain-containing protein [Halobacteria archaeon AArc-m2/3/4]|uniref:Methyltransferase domain-containing protein n=1 Tax=Natronoglomus mannanivorans TaxID=2979990 RepID=A0ABT2QGA5_9EURY|nr:methyltransferase domain-containing protein [Halobacteria archaeon AArc-m2/3/4]
MSIERDYEDERRHVKGVTTTPKPPGPIARVSRPKAAARDWYDVFSTYYNTVADPFEAPARNAGLELLDATPGERVLDVGCGTGNALVALARAVGANGTAVGIDLAEGMCRASRRALTDAGLEWGVVVEGDAATTPFRKNTFDALFASFVLELFDTPEILTVLDEWRRVLDPGGRLCVVSLSRRGGGPYTRLYETVHDLVPTYVDCRPIYVRETLLEAGFRIVDEREETAWQLPVEVVHCRIT